MLMSAQNNAITRRLDRLAKQWDSEASASEVKVGVWSVTRDELQMIEAFYEVEKTEEGKTQDLFLKFEAPYINHDQYTKSLLQEFDKMLKDSNEDLVNAGLSPENWVPLKANNFHPGLFAKNLEAFQQFLGVEGNVVAYLSPAQNNNIEAWTDWMEKWSMISFEGVKIMLLQSEEYPVFEKLISFNPKAHRRLIPNLNMASAMTELAAQGNPSDPGTQFRQLYVAMMQAAGESDLKSTKSLANRALVLAKKHGMILMEATVHLVLGGVYLSNKKKKEALISYDTAIEVLKKEKTDPQIAKQQMVIAYLSKGMALFVNKAFELAAQVYEEAAILAKKVDNKFLALDSWRMAGTCHGKASHNQNAKACYGKSIKVGMQLEQKERRQTTMPSAAMELFLLESSSSRIELNELMNTAVGSDWKELSDIKEQMANNRPS